MPPSRRLIATCGVLSGTFLGAIEATIVATAMPTVVGQLGGLSHYSWVFSAYLLTSTVTMPVWGKLADLYGRRPPYLAAVALFVLGSTLSGTSRSMTTLIVFRAVQGVGAGGLVPLGLTILGDLYTLKERARMQGLFSGVWGVASIVGPVVGGYITEQFSWRWVFLLNIPFGLATAALAGWALEEPARRSAPPRIDYRGAAVLTSAVSLLMIALTQTGASDARLGPVLVAALYVASCGLGWLFVRIERRAPEPIFPLELVTDRLFAPLAICSLLVGAAVYAAISFVPLFVQQALGGSATQAGTLLTPLLLGWVAMAIVTGRLLPRFGHRRLIVLGLALITTGFAGLVGVTEESSYWYLRGALAVIGLGMGLTALSLLLALQNAVPRHQLGTATSFSLFTRTIGGAIGVALAGAIVAVSVDEAAVVSPAAMELALHRVFLVSGVVSFVGLLVGLKVPARLPGAFRSGPGIEQAFGDL